MKYKIISIVFCISGTFLFILQLHNNYQKEFQENKNIIDKITITTNYKEDNPYNSILSIPMISLKKGLYDINDNKNNIEENIMIHKNSIMPDNNNSNLILVAHSGTGEKAFFKDIYKLNSDSLIEYYYNNTKYIYKIDNYYKVNKTGKVEIKRDINKKTITLITCDQSNKSKQLIYIGYIIDEIKL